MNILARPIGNVRKSGAAAIYAMLGRMHEATELARQLELGGPTQASEIDQTHRSLVRALAEIGEDAAAVNYIEQIANPENRLAFLSIVAELR